VWHLGETLGTPRQELVTDDREASTFSDAETPLAWIHHNAGGRRAKVERLGRDRGGRAAPGLEPALRPHGKARTGPELHNPAAFTDYRELRHNGAPMLHGQGDDACAVAQAPR
jgi:hypothetical protein